MTVDKKLSQTFQIANLIATCLVISIHYNSKMHIPISNMGDWNFLIQEFITNGIARIAVPFFALSAGFFFFLKYKNIQDYKSNIRKRYSSLVIPYLIACSFIFVIDYIHFGILKELPYTLTLQSIADDIILHPLSVQFWFLRDLIILCILSPLLFLLIKHLSTLFVFILLILWSTNTQITPLLSGRELITIETLTFFSIGAYISIKKIKINSITNSTIIPIIISGLLFVVLIAIRIYIDPTTSFKNLGSTIGVSIILYKVTILVGLYWLLITSSHLLNEKLIYLSSFTYFAFLYHLLPLSKVITKSASLIMDDEYQFYITFPLATLLAFSLAIFVNRYFDHLYKITTGNRTPDKILKRLS